MAGNCGCVLITGFFGVFMVDRISICQQYISYELWRDTSNLVDVLSGDIVGRVGVFLRKYFSYSTHCRGHK